MAFFPTGKWQFVHAIDFTLADGARGDAIGVSVVDRPRIDCVIMTVEGFVLFAAHFDGHLLTIKRAVPPFDGHHFARGLLADMELIFFPPGGRLIETGTLPNGDRVRRYAAANGALTDLIRHAESGWEIDRYNADRSLARTVQARFQPGAVPASGFRVPTDLELVAPGRQGYHLRLHLIRATKGKSS